MRASLFLAFLLPSVGGCYLLAGTTFSEKDGSGGNRSSVDGGRSSSNNSSDPESQTCAEPPCETNPTCTGCMKVRDVAVGTGEAFVVQEDGRLRYWGYGSSRNLGMPENEEITHIELDQTYGACARKAKDGSLACWRRAGEVEVPLPQATGVTAFSVGFRSGIIANGALVSWGSSSTKTPTTGGWESVASAGIYLCATRSGGETWCNYEDPAKPASARAIVGGITSTASEAFCALHPVTSKAVCWSKSAALAVPDVAFSYVALGQGVACGVQVSDGAIQCWKVDPGAEFFPSDPPTSGPYRKISLAYGAACAIRTTGELDCWGKYPPPITP